MDNVISFDKHKDNKLSDRYFCLLTSVLGAVMEAEGPSELLRYLAWEMENAAEDPAADPELKAMFEKWQEKLSEAADEMEKDIPV